MKIVFINPSLRPDAQRRHLPVGLAYIMTAVKKSGYDFDLIDLDIDKISIEELEIVLSRNEYDVYATGCIVTGYRFVRKISKIIKKMNPQATIIAGNSVATSIPKLLLANTFVDVAVIGEGDVTIVELLHAIDKKKDLHEVQGIAFKDGVDIVLTPRRKPIPNLDKIGFPDWNFFNLEKYHEYAYLQANTFSPGQQDQFLSYPLNSARGCPFNCTFCYHVFKKDPYRKYSLDAIVAEIRRLHDNYNCNFISFWDELTFPNTKSVSALLEKLSELEFQIGWRAPSRGDLFTMADVALIEAMKESGCESIAFSLENASPEILKAMNKKLNVAQVIEHSKALWAGGVTPLTSVIFGYPQETPESIQLTLDVCDECNIFPSVGFLLPLPGTPIYKWAIEQGYIQNEIEYLERIGDRQDFHINLTAMDDQEFVDTVTTKLNALAQKQGLKLESVFKTVTYQRPKLAQ